MPMFEMTAGMFNFFWSGAAMIGLWLLWRIFEVVKAIHFITLERFNQVSTEPIPSAGPWARRDQVGDLLRFPAPR